VADCLEHLIQGFQLEGLGLRCRVLMFTMDESDRLAIEVREAQTHGYVLKSQAARDQVVAVETLLAGGTVFGAPPKSERAQNDDSNPGILFCVDLQLAISY
jgi:DNA-binding NarL/FixJ family response regulator